MEGYTKHCVKITKYMYDPWIKKISSMKGHKFKFVIQMTNTRRVFTSKSQLLAYWNKWIHRFPSTVIEYIDSKPGLPPSGRIMLGRDLKMGSLSRKKKKKRLGIIVQSGLALPYLVYDVIHRVVSDMRTLHSIHTTQSMPRLARVMLIGLARGLKIPMYSYRPYVVLPNGMRPLRKRLTWKEMVHDCTHVLAIGRRHHKEMVECHKDLEKHDITIILFTEIDKLQKRYK